MKKILLTAILLAAGIVTATAQEREVYSLIGWDSWGGLEVRNSGDAIIVSGRVGSGSAGYVIES